ncbi:GntR family transcriptional regulator [Paenibacillus ginsengarvi]|jgi:GntR family transcriptional regulator|uniref:GntR family transcriptional regulator n=1 Tax=Paenibacillus ginsengarvi TaxID=400777 RepID=A0A3B0CCG7_9BACL|nr:GntR family transcriptional regulator [Paenibacillus ginsengarvi]RKN80646.1 GntR family transcriptional regulator [Paenibacillus ginsengarvi]
MTGQQVGSLRFQIDFSQPLYEQILDQVRSSIAKGEIGLGDKMPSVRELAQELRMNPNTVMRAYQELERDGLTEKRRGQGTYVTSSPERVQTFRTELASRYIEAFLTQMESLGLSWNDIEQYVQGKTDKEGGSQS